jgi:uncharacterized membrane protein (GlpM family)
MSAAQGGAPVADALLLAKLVATPSTIAFVSWVERRFGPSLAGLVFGFPLTSSLASVFLAAEQGAGFARATAVGLLVGIATFALFIAAFAQAAGRGARWPAALAVALAVYLPAAYGGTFLGGLGRGQALLLGGLALAAAAATMPRGLGGAPPRPHGRWELPLRMAIATALVVAITALASRAGPTLTGILLLVPVSTATVASFVLARAGPASVVRMLRGLAWGCFSFVAFFAVAGSALARMATWLAFALATLAALGCSGLTWRLAISRHTAATDDAVD